MKVLIISHLYPSKYQPANGVFVHEQVKELIKQGCEITVVSPVKLAPFPLNRLSKKWENFSKTPHHEKIDGIDVYHPRYPSLPKNILFEKSGQFMYQNIAGLVKELHAEKQFDFIHAHVALPDGYAAYKVSKDLQLPYVLTIHGQDFQKTIHYNHKCKSRIEEAVINASKVILVSSKLERLLHDAKFQGKVNYTVIPNGVDFGKIKLTNSPSYFRTEGPKLLSVSNLYTEKAIDINLKSVSQLIDKYPNLEYIIVGDGPQKQNLMNLANTLGIQDQVRFLGAFKHEDVLNIMQECDVFSMPSTNEAFGVVYIEAMSLGKPVIGCIGEGPQDIIDHEENGYLMNKNDVEQLSAILDHLFSDKVLQQQLGEKAKRTVEEKFQWNNVAKKLIEEYKNLI